MRKNFSIRLREDLRASLEERAKKNHRNLGQEISFLIDRALQFESCGEAKDLSAFIHGCQAARSIEAMTEAQG